MFGKKHQRRVRHQRLMRLASVLVDRTILASVLVSSVGRPANPADLVALAFGRHQMEVTEEEAARYLDAALVERGERLLRPAGAVELPELDTDAETQVLDSVTSNQVADSLLFFRDIHGDPVTWTADEYERWLWESDAAREKLAQICEQFPDMPRPLGVGLR
ncbi:hypothetical protein [Streptomyces sp. HF10]|uniref:hypothetical protein n=1 Tax=Streptomyces sp. HF10 TaxID=2692233 RepID=UPI0013189AFC|nr:hypothetical protein [Streptomyces sp. HF10]QHC33912.1 hypothetical protein GR129_35020 [Streptomyces sp. HF10]